MQWGRGKTSEDMSFTFRILKVEGENQHAHAHIHIQAHTYTHTHTHAHTDTSTHTQTGAHMHPVHMWSEACRMEISYIPPKSHTCISSAKQNPGASLLF